MKTVATRVAAIAAGACLLISAYHRTDSSSVMAKAAIHFLASLTPEQRAKTVISFKDDERLNWYYTPHERKGLPLKEMTTPQRHLAHALLSAGLSQSGYIKAVTIMSLEEVLRVIEKGSGPERDPERYFFSIFGEPSDKGAWGYRVEGHHLSQNFTVVNGSVVGAPSFFGANPEEVKEGPRKGLRTLAAEEDLARDLLNSLTPDQKKIAIVDGTAYADILTTNSRKAAIDGKPSGISAGKMTRPQVDKLMSLLTEYAENVPEQLAQARMEQIKAAGSNITFTWTGSDQRGAPHYYRVQSPSFLIEFDDTQNNANHIHSVWRDFNGDFGLDLLKLHYQTSHR